VQTILFADDNQSIRTCCQEEFEGEGYRVVLASDGSEAVDLLRTERPDLVVLDIRMPRMGGLDAIQRIHAIAPQVPVILFTANGADCREDDRSQLAMACVGKCEDLAELKRIIVRLLNPEKRGIVRSALPSARTSEADSYDSTGMSVE
jgi:CheY-like chemotaxis protein